MNKLIIIFIAIVVSVSNLYSQNKTISGKVITEYLEPVPYALIFINDSVEVGRTDSNGFLQIDIPVSVEKLLFKGVGFEPAIIKLAGTCNDVEIVMMLSGTYDFMTLKKVDKLRKKKFNRLSEIHKEAFSKGIFKTNNVCSTQEFIAYYKKKRN